MLTTSITLTALMAITGQSCQSSQAAKMNYSTPSIIEVASTNSDFSTLTAAIKAADLDGALRNFWRREVFNASATFEPAAQPWGLLLTRVNTRQMLPERPCVPAPPCGNFTPIRMVVNVGVGFEAATTAFLDSLRCAGFNGLGTTWANVSRLLEGLASAAVLVAGAGALALCLATLAVRVLLLVWQWVLLRRCCPWLFEPRQAADAGLVRRLLWPSLAFMAFPVGLALALQGPILIIGGLFGPAAVATFSAMRTLARLPVQFTNVLNAAVAPEVSRAHGQAMPGVVQRLHRRAWWATAAFGLLACGALAWLGPWLGNWWLGEGRHDQGLLVGLLLVSWVSAVWNVSSIVLTATNRHVRLSAVFLTVNALGLALAWGLGAVSGLPALVGALVCAELLMLLWVTPAARRAAAAH